MAPRNLLDHQGTFTQKIQSHICLKDWPLQEWYVCAPPWMPSYLYSFTVCQESGGYLEPWKKMWDFSMWNCLILKLEQELLNSREAWKTPSQISDKVNIISNGTNWNHGPLDKKQWTDLNITSVIFLPEEGNLNLIMKIHHWTGPKWGTLYKITCL